MLLLTVTSTFYHPSFQALETKLASCRNIVREPSMAAGATPVHLRRSSLLLNSSSTPRGLKRTMQQPQSVEDGSSPQRGPGGVIKISVWEKIIASNIMELPKSWRETDIKPEWYRYFKFNKTHFVMFCKNLEENCDKVWTI